MPVGFSDVIVRTKIKFGTGTGIGICHGTGIWDRDWDRDWHLGRELGLGTTAQAFFHVTTIRGAYYQTELSRIISNTPDFIF